jgi:hypothetical protein
MATCKLCLQNKKLLKKSHIIPDFMYRETGMYDSSHRIRKFSVQRVFKIITDLFSPPTGEYDKNILCARCDNEIIGHYETYARKALFGGELPADENPIVTHHIDLNGKRFSICQNIDYNKFKLFLLSILWRASITQRDFFQYVNLNLEKEEQLRDMILNGNPGEINDFPIFLYTYLNDNSVACDIIGMPIHSIHETIETITFLLGGTFYIFYLGNNRLDPSIIRDQTLNKNNRMLILHIPQGQGWEYILRFAGIH